MKKQYRQNLSILQLEKIAEGITKKNLKTLFPQLEI